MAPRFLLLDVDNTLYARSCGIVERVDGLINRYLVERMGIPAAEVETVRHELRQAHGTTLRGLMHRHRIDPDDYLRFVHAIDLAAMLAPDRALGAMLDRIPLSKVAVTNGSAAHAHAVLDRLDVRDRFLRVYALEQMAYVPKPFPEAYHAVLADLPANAGECILVEDSAPNLTTARRLGMQTVHLSDGQLPHPEAHVAIRSILELEEALARLAVSGKERA
jgi:putative hydrolase of the HAD superfamily